VVEKRRRCDHGQYLKAAAAGYETIAARCVKFDNALWDETIKAGGKDYADLCVLAFRQSIAAHKLTSDKDGNILFLSKENFSNGSIGTVMSRILRLRCSCGTIPSFSRE